MSCSEAARASTRHLETKQESSQDWQLLVDSILVENKSLKKDIIEFLSKHGNLWSGLIGMINATHRLIDLKDKSRSIRQQPYHFEHSCREVICEYEGKQLEADVI